MKRLALGRFFAKSDIGQRKSNNQKSKSNQSEKVNIPKSHKFSFLNRNAKYKAIILAKISSVNTTSLNFGSTPGNNGEATASPIQNTERLINQSANTDLKIGFRFAMDWNVSERVSYFNI